MTEQSSSRLLPSAFFCLFFRVFRGCCLLFLFFRGGVCLADPPVASYVFPAGGQRGKAVAVRVGGLFLHRECHWELAGKGVTVTKLLRHQPTRWFEGPMLPLPASQQAEDYPRDMG